MDSDMTSSFVSCILWFARLSSQEQEKVRHAIQAVNVNEELSKSLGSLTLGLATSMKRKRADSLLPQKLSDLIITWTHLHEPSQEEWRRWGNRPSEFWFPNIHPRHKTEAAFIGAVLKNSDNVTISLRYAEYLAFRMCNRIDPAKIIRNEALGKLRDRFNIEIEIEELRKHVLAGRKLDRIFVKEFGLGALVHIPTTASHTHLTRKVDEGRILEYHQHLRRLQLGEKVYSTRSEGEQLISWVTNEFDLKGLEGIKWSSGKLREQRPDAGLHMLLDAATTAKSLQDHVQMSGSNLDAGYTELGITTGPVRQKSAGTQSLRDGATNPRNSIPVLPGLPAYAAPDGDESLIQNGDPSFSGFPVTQDIIEVKNHGKASW